METVSKRFIYEQLSGLYTICDKDKVFHFLNNQEDLINLLMKEAPIEIKKYFPGSELQISFIQDIEDPSWTFIRLQILTSLDVDVAFEKLSQLETNWWFEKSMQELLITVKFV